MGGASHGQNAFMPAEVVSNQPHCVQEWQPHQKRQRSYLLQSLPEAPWTTGTLGCDWHQSRQCRRPATRAGARSRGSDRKTAKQVPTARTSKRMRDVFPKAFSEQSREKRNSSTACFLGKHVNGTIAFHAVYQDMLLQEIMVLALFASHTFLHR